MKGVGLANETRRRVVRQTSKRTLRMRMCPVDCGVQCRLCTAASVFAAHDCDDLRLNNHASRMRLL